MCEVTFLCCFSGVEDLAGLGDQLVPQMNYPENLEIYNPDSAGVEFIPLHNEGTSSVSKQDNVVCIVKWKSSFFHTASFPPQKKLIFI